MNTSGEVADLMVKESIQITESAAKLAAVGAKNLAAIIIAMVQDGQKLQGKTNLKQLLKSEKPLCILQIKKEDIQRFKNEAKKYGVLFTAVTDKTQNTELCDIIAKQEDVTKLNYIMERMNYAVPNEQPEHTSDKEKEATDNVKKSTPRGQSDRSEKRYTARGDNDTRDTKPSVKGRIQAIKAQQKSHKPRQPKTKMKERG